MFPFKQASWEKKREPLSSLNFEIFDLSINSKGKVLPLRELIQNLILIFEDLL